MNEPVQTARINFRFECRPGCVNCCTRPGDVFLTAEDRDRIAAHLGMSAAEFERRYCDHDPDGLLRLTNPSSNSCHFLLEGGCAVHDVKPLQCRTFPFWPENVRSRQAWKGVRGYCPGIGVGQILPLETVVAAAQACADAFPEIE